MGRQVDKQRTIPIADMRYQKNFSIKSQRTVVCIVTHRYIAFTIMPTIRPNVAPMAMDGTKIPAGTLHPYERMTKPTRNIVAKSNEFAIRHCTPDLSEKIK